MTGPGSALALEIHGKERFDAAPTTRDVTGIALERNYHKDMELRRAVMPGGCTLLPFDTITGVCAACGTGLTGRRTRWCSKDCERIYHVNHYWGFARAAALARDGRRCVQCGWVDDWHFSQLPGGQLLIWSRAGLLRRGPDNWLEVNHIVPRCGAGYGTGCGHHLENLETLCHPCHVKVTNRQRVTRARALAS